MIEQGVLFDKAASPVSEGRSYFHGESQWLVSRVELERLLEISARQLATFEAREVISPAVRGKPGVESVYDVREVIPRYLRYLRSKRAGGSDGAKARREEAQAILAEIRAKKLAGELIPVIQVQENWSQIMVHFRTALSGLHVWARLHCAALSLDDARVIDRRVQEILVDLARGKMVSGEAHTHDSNERANVYPVGGSGVPPHEIKGNATSD